MKTKQIVKVSLFTLILAFIVGGMFAIAAVMKKEKPVEVRQMVLLKTWHFTGGIGSSPTNASLYVESSSPSCSPGKNTICLIEAPDDGTGQPDMTAPVDIDNPDPNEPTPTVASQINDAISSEETNETVKSLRNF